MKRKYTARKIEWNHPNSASLLLCLNGANFFEQHPIIAIFKHTETRSYIRTGFLCVQNLEWKDRVWKNWHRLNSTKWAHCYGDSIQLASSVFIRSCQQPVGDGIMYLISTYLARVYISFAPLQLVISWSPHIFAIITQLLAWHMQETLQWRHNERNSSSNHRCHYCLLKRFFMRRSKKASKLRVTGLCREIHRCPVNSRTNDQ